MNNTALGEFLHALAELADSRHAEPERLGGLAVAFAQLMDRDAVLATLLLKVAPEFIAAMRKHAGKKS